MSDEQGGLWGGSARGGAVAVVRSRTREILGAFLFSCVWDRGEVTSGWSHSTKFYFPSTMRREGKLILHFPVSPFHKYDALIFIIPHTLSFWKEITGDSLFSLHHIFQLGSPLLQIISFLLPEALQQSSSHSIGILFSLHFRKKCKLKNNYIFNDRLILLY